MFVRLLPIFALFLSLSAFGFPERDQVLILDEVAALPAQNVTSWKTDKGIVARLEGDRSRALFSKDIITLTLKEGAQVKIEILRRGEDCKLITFTRTLPGAPEDQKVFSFDPAKAALFDRAFEAVQSLQSKLLENPAIPAGMTLVLEHRWVPKKGEANLPRIQLNFQSSNGRPKVVEVFDQRNVRRELSVLRYKFDESGNFLITIVDKTTKDSNWSIKYSGNLWSEEVALIDGETGSRRRIQMKRTLIRASEDAEIANLLLTAEVSNIVEVIEKKNGLDFAVFLEGRFFWIRRYSNGAQRKYSIAEGSRIIEGSSTAFDELFARLSVAIPQLHLDWASAVEGYRCVPSIKGGERTLYVWYEVLHGKLVVHAVEQHPCDELRDSSTIYPHVKVSDVVYNENGTALITTEEGVLKFTPLSTKNGTLLRSIFAFDLIRDSTELSAGFDRVGDRIHISGIKGIVLAQDYAHFKAKGTMPARSPSASCRIRLVEDSKIPNSENEED